MTAMLRRAHLEHVGDLCEVKTWCAGYALRGFATVIQETRPNVYRGFAYGETKQAPKMPAIVGKVRAQWR